MKLKNLDFILTLTVLVGFVCLVGTKDAAAKRRAPAYWVKKVNLEANILFNDQTLAKVVDLGKGIKMTPGIIELLVDEIEGFYSSHGHFLVKVDIPKKRPHKGILKLRVSETEDIMAGNGEEDRAKRTLEQLISVASLKVDEQMKEEVIEKLTQGYRVIRFEKAEAQKAEEEAKKQEEAERLAEEKVLQEVEAQKEEESKRQEEAERLAEEKVLQEVEAQKEEESKRQEEAEQLAEEKALQEVEAQKAEEESKRQEEAERLAKEKARQEVEALKETSETEPVAKEMIEEMEGKQAALTKSSETQAEMASDIMIISEKGKQLVIRKIKFGYFKTLSHGKVSQGGREKFKDTVNNVVGEKFEFFEQDRIPLVIGDAFGVQWDVPEIDRSDAVILEKVWELPSPDGKKEKSENSLKLKWVYTKKAQGDINRWKFQDYKGFNLPGNWVLSFYNKGKLVLSKNFTIYKPEE